IALLQSGGNQLDDLNQAYRNIARSHNIQTVSYYETQKTKKLAFVVTREDADPGVGLNPIPAPSCDHIDISNPANRKVLVYTSVLRHLKRVVEDTQATPTPISFKSARENEISQTLNKFIGRWLSDQLDKSSRPEIEERIKTGAFDQWNNAKKNAIVG